MNKIESYFIQYLKNKNFNSRNNQSTLRKFKSYKLTTASRFDFLEII